MEIYLLLNKKFSSNIFWFPNCKIINLIPTIEFIKFSLSCCQAANVIKPPGRPSDVSTTSQHLPAFPGYHKAHLLSKVWLVSNRFIIASPQPIKHKRRSNCNKTRLAAKGTIYQVIKAREGQWDNEKVFPLFCGGWTIFWLHLFGCQAVM